MKLHKSGFTLVEIMIVVAIIALLASIAIPNLERANKLSRWNSEVIKSVNALVTASEMYFGNNGDYPHNLTSLTSATPPYINSDLETACTTNSLGEYYLYCEFYDDNPNRAFLFGVVDTPGRSTFDKFRYVEFMFRFTTVSTCDRGQKCTIECFDGQLIQNDSDVTGVYDCDTTD